VLIQDVCPGRRVSHIGSAVDSVTYALVVDALRHKGPGRRSRLLGDVCSHPYGTGLDEATTTPLVTGAGGLTAGRIATQPRVRREPRVRKWAR
jgi:triacylglycerol lipase